jgi:hypothetical protein
MWSRLFLFILYVCDGELEMKTYWGAWVAWCSWKARKSLFTLEDIRFVIILSCLEQPIQINIPVSLL